MNPFKVLSAVLLAATLSNACKVGQHGKGSDETGDSSNAPAPNGRDVPYLVHVRIALEGEPKIVSLQEVQATFVGSCLNCHGQGASLDMRAFPFAGRFATPQESVEAIISRLKNDAAPMPPPPAPRVPAEQIALVEAWLKDGLPLAQPVREAPAFAQGLVFLMRYRATGTAEWKEASLPWNGSGDFPGFFQQIGAGQTVDVNLIASAEDGTVLATQAMQAMSMPEAGTVEFSLSVEEKLIKDHATDRGAATPGADGTIASSDVLERSFDVHFEPASDLLTPSASLLYAVLVGDHLFASVEDVLATGRKVQDFGPYQAKVRIDGLDQGKTYFVAVLVKDKGGNVAVYKILEQATAADRVVPKPPVPAKITASDLSDVSVTLSWKASTDNLTAPEKLSYQVYAGFQNATGDPASEAVQGRTTVTLKGLVPEATYYFDVMVADEAGNQSWYNRISVTTGTGNGVPLSLQAYGRQCAERLGSFQAFNCTEGQIIPIAIGGQEIPVGLSAAAAQDYSYGTGANQMKCDKPALLGLGDEGRCVPYSRIGRLASYRKDGTVNPNVDAVFLCRRYVTRLGPQSYQGKTYDGADLPLYEDIAVLQHDRVTGETCWFQMLQPNYASVDGTRVPSPTEDAAGQFWLSPQSTAARNCYRCHDADPWMHSPYVDQVKAADGKPLVPPGGFGSGSGKYSMLGSRAFNKWPKSFGVASTVTSDTNGASCTSCHHIGSFVGCQATGWAKQAAGEVLAPNLSAAGQAFDLRYWMPPPSASIHSFADWQNSGFKRAAERLATCCANPNQPGCSQTPIMTPPPPHE